MRLKPNWTKNRPFFDQGKVSRHPTGGGIPSCPDHSEKATLWKLLEAEERTGATLTTSYAMNPPSSVSGYYLNHSDAKYFNLGLIGEDQVADYAARKNISQPEAEKWLRPHLGYDEE